MGFSSGRLCRHARNGNIFAPACGAWTPHRRYAEIPPPPPVFRAICRSWQTLPCPPAKARLQDKPLGAYKTKGFYPPICRPGIQAATIRRQENVWKPCREKRCLICVGYRQPKNGLNFSNLRHTMSDCGKRQAIFAGNSRR